MKLRPYQQEAVTSIEESWKECDRTLLVLPTGCGKTIVFNSITENLVHDNKRVLILAHREELLTQAAEKLKRVTGIDSALEKAEHTSIGSGLNVTIGSVQTISTDKRLGRFDRRHFDNIIIDEAHHCLSSSYQNVLNYFNSAKVLGVTATPDRGDKKNLGKYFESVAYEYTLPQAIKEGYLAPIKAQMIPVNIDLSSVKMSQGDFQTGDLGNALGPYLEDIADKIVIHARDRKTVVFLPLVSTSQEFCEMLNKRGMKACEVNGNTPNREEILRAFEDGKYNVICNSMLLTEGWDCPSVDCVVVLRPTKVRSLYCQMIGRGTRLCEGKKDLLVLDFLWHTTRHDLCRPVSLIAKSDEEVEAVLEMVKDNPEQFDISEVLEKEREDAKRQREEALAKALQEQKDKRSKCVDYIKFIYSINMHDLEDYEPMSEWEAMEPTEKQIKRMEKFGINPDGIDTRGLASQILDRCFKRVDAGLSTAKQIRCLERKGFKSVSDWTFDDANRMIARLVKNEWKIPDGINPSIYVPSSVMSWEDAI